MQGTFTAHGQAVRETTGMMVYVLVLYMYSPIAVRMDVPEEKAEPSNQTKPHHTTPHHTRAMPMPMPMPMAIYLHVPHGFLVISCILCIMFCITVKYRISSHHVSLYHILSIPSATPGRSTNDMHLLLRTLPKQNTTGRCKQPSVSAPTYLSGTVRPDDTDNPSSGKLKVHPVVEQPVPLRLAQVLQAIPCHTRPFHVTLRHFIPFHPVSYPSCYVKIVQGRRGGTQSASRDEYENNQQADADWSGSAGLHDRLPFAVDSAAMDGSCGATGGVC